jgi:hypothetical protein
MLPKLPKQNIIPIQPDDRANGYRDLIRKEAAIGGTLFGDLPQGCHRDFFCLDKHTWVWHEECIDQIGIKQSQTTYYNIGPAGVVKHQNGQASQSLSPNEAVNLREAINLYFKRVMTELYRQPV